MRIVCWQTILMIYHTLFFRKLVKMSQKSSAAVVLGALRVNNGLNTTKVIGLYGIGPRITKLTNTVLAPSIPLPHSITRALRQRHSLTN